MMTRRRGPENIDEASFYDFPYPLDIINHIKKKFGDWFEIAVAGYPLQHPESANLEEEMRYMKAKYDAGARYIITQSIFSYPAVKAYLQTLKSYDIKAKVIPGLYVMSSITDYILLQKLCKIPNDDEMAYFVDEHKGDNEAISTYGRETAKKMVYAILEDNELMPPHIFTMNEFDIIRAFLEDFQNE